MTTRQFLALNPCLAGKQYALSFPSINDAWDACDDVNSLCWLAANSRKCQDKLSIFAWECASIAQSHTEMCSTSVYSADAATNAAANAVTNTAYSTNAAAYAAAYAHAYAYAYAAADAAAYAYAYAAANAAHTTAAAAYAAANAAAYAYAYAAANAAYTTAADVDTADAVADAAYTKAYADAISTERKWQCVRIKQLCTHLIFPK